MPDPSVSPDDPKVKEARAESDKNLADNTIQAQKASNELERDAASEALERGVTKLISPKGPVCDSGTQSLEKNPNVPKRVPGMIKDIFKDLSDAFEKTKNLNEAFEIVKEKALNDSENRYDPKQKKDFLEFADKIKEEGGNKLKKYASKSFEKVKNFVKDIFKSRGKGETKITPDNIKDVVKELDDNLKDIDKNDPEIAKEFKRFKDLLDKLNAKNIEEGKPPENKWSLKEILKCLALLIFIGGVSVGIWALVEFCNNNTGCMQVVLEDSSDEQTKTKIMCRDNTSFASQNCYCLDKPPTETISISDVKLCSDSKTTPEMTHYRKCENKDTLKAPYVYYTYRVMDPITGLENLLKDFGDDIGGAFDSIIKALKTVGWVILALMIAYIVFKIVTKFIK